MRDILPVFFLREYQDEDAMSSMGRLPGPSRCNYLRKKRCTICFKRTTSSSYPVGQAAYRQSACLRMRITATAKPLSSYIDRAKRCLGLGVSIPTGRDQRMSDRRSRFLEGRGDNWNLRSPWQKPRWHELIFSQTRGLIHWWYFMSWLCYRSRGIRGLRGTLSFETIEAMNSKALRARPALYLL